MCAHGTTPISVRCTKGFPRMQKFIRGPEFRKLARDAIKIGNEYLGSDTDPELNLAKSPALNLRPEQIEVLERQYKAEAAYYFKGNRHSPSLPAWSTVFART